MDNIYIYHGSLDGWYRAQLSNVPKPSTKNNNNELYIMTLVVFMMSEIRYWSRLCADLAWHRMAIAIMPMALIVCVCVRVCSNVFFLASHIHGVMSQVWNVPMFGVVNACIPIVKLKNLVIKTTIMSGGKCQYEWYNFHFIKTALEIRDQQHVMCRNWNDNEQDGEKKWARDGTKKFSELFSWFAL